MHLDVALTTPRLRLRPLDLTDLPLMIRWERDPILRYFNDEYLELPSEDEVRESIVRWANPSRDNLISFAVEVQASGACIGYAMLALIDQAVSECFVGLTIGERAAWGCGYGGEVLGALTECAFDRLRLHRVYAEIFAFNERSLRLFERAGYRPVERKVAVVERNGQWWDEVVLLRERRDRRDGAS